MINHIHPSFLEPVHQASANYPKEVSKFHELGLTPEFLEASQELFLKESKVSYTLTLVEIIPTKLINTFLSIRKPNHVKLEDNIRSSGSFWDLIKLLLSEVIE